MITNQIDIDKLKDKDMSGLSILGIAARNDFKFPFKVKRIKDSLGLGGYQDVTIIEAIYKDQDGLRTNNETLTTVQCAEVNDYILYEDQIIFGDEPKEFTPEQLEFMEILASKDEEIFNLKKERDDHFRSCDLFGHCVCCDQKKIFISKYYNSKKLLEQAVGYIEGASEYHYSLRKDEREQWIKDYSELK